MLVVEGYPRYEYRYAKVLLEREIEAGRAVRSFDLNTLLLDASKDHPSTDRTALRNPAACRPVGVLGDPDIVPNYPLPASP